ncbi:MAG: YgjV family protein [Chloroflexi bacterium]|nr:YgjV family protein [Chloroflexota bacterium]
MIEIFGYIASVLVAISLMMRSILRLRIISLIGSICFTIYGYLIGAFPITAVNLIIVFINLYYLYGIYTASEYFTMLSVAPNSEYLDYFLRFHAREIWQFQPNFQYTPSQKHLAFFALRDLVPAGVLIGKMEPDHTMRLKLDFVIPGYRDFKIGKFVYGGQTAVFHENGIHRIVSEPGSKKHNDYLQRMGFQLPDGAKDYCLELNNN